VFHDAYHPNADKLTTARTISLAGDVTGSTSFDGSGNVSITATVADDSHNHVISNVDGLQTALNNKAPLTGTGTSGTWPISVTGNAATVTNGVYTTGNQTITGTKIFQNSTPSTGTSAKHLELFSPEGAAIDEVSLMFHQGNRWYHQIRSSGNGFQFTAGDTSSRVAIIANQLYGTIFYDTNNTGYYVDPASTSNIVGLTVTNTISGSITGNAATASSASTLSNNSTITGLNFGGVLALTGSGATTGNATGTRLSENYGPLWDCSDSATWHHQVINGSMLCGFLAAGTNWGSGKVVCNSDMRAPIYYDYDDTGYYLDPNSTSQSAGRMRGGTLHGPNTGWGDYLLVGGNGREGYINNTTVASVCTTNGNLHLDAASAHQTYINYYDGTNVYFGNGNNGTVIIFDSSGNGTFNGSVSSPIFYDSNNTAYYVDPASGSVLSGNVVINQSAVSYTSNDNTPLVGSTTENRLHVNGSIQLTSNDDAIVFGRGTATFIKDEEIGFGWGGGWYMTEGTLLRVRNNKSVYSAGDARFTTYYDSNNTGYYVVPVGTSRLNVLVADRGLGSSGGHHAFAANIGGAIPAYNNTQVEIRNTDGGNVGIDLHRSGYTHAAIYHDGSANIRVTGDFIAAGNVTAYSDIRKKTNIEVIPNAVDKVKQIRGVTYDRIDLEFNSRQAGVIAQEVLEVLPEAVIGSEETEYAVAYGNMVGLLIEAIKEQQGHIEALQKRIEHLEGTDNGSIKETNYV
jgi:hypothetical protein